MIIFQMMISIDGYFEGPKKDLSWHNVDKEFNDYAQDFLNHVDILLFGRKTFQMMAAYWPTEHARNDDPIIAKKMNSLRKIVLSRTLKKAEWENTTIIRNVAELKKIKGTIAIFGSSALAVALMEKNLIDEFRIFINPVVLGGGKQLFKGAKRMKLKLVNTKVFESGNVMLTYTR